jgi:hypothetical protein
MRVLRIYIHLMNKTGRGRQKGKFGTPVEIELSRSGSFEGNDAAGRIDVACSWCVLWRAFIWPRSVGVELSGSVVSIPCIKVDIGALELYCGVRRNVPATAVSLEVCFRNENRARKTSRLSLWNRPTNSTRAMPNLFARENFFGREDEISTSGTDNFGAGMRGSRGRKRLKVSLIPILLVKSRCVEEEKSMSLSVRVRNTFE